MERSLQRKGFLLRREGKACGLCCHLFELIKKEEISCLQNIQESSFNLKRLGNTYSLFQKIKSPFYIHVPSTLENL